MFKNAFCYQKHRYLAKTVGQHADLLQLLRFTVQGWKVMKIDLNRPSLPNSSTILSRPETDPSRVRNISLLKAFFIDLSRSGLGEFRHKMDAFWRFEPGNAFLAEVNDFFPGGLLPFL